MIGLLLFYILMIFNLVALCYAVVVVPPEIIKEDIRPLFFVIPMPPFLIGFDLYISGYAAVVFFLLLAAAIFLSFELLVYREGRSFFRIGTKLLSEELLEEEERMFDDNSFVLIGELFMATIFFNLIYIILLFAMGIDPESPDFDEYHSWELMFGFARASVWEEVVSRIMLIGLPLLVIRKVFGGRSTEGEVPGKEDSGGGSRSRSYHHYLFGGNLEITPLIAVLIFISSLLFGLAHIGSWDYHKIVPTIVAGLVMGYLFVRKGVHTSIIFHFAVDYLSVLPDAVGSEVGIFIAGITVLFIVVLFSLGAYMFYKYGLKVQRYLLGSILRRNSVVSTGENMEEEVGANMSEDRFDEIGGKLKR